MLMPLSTLRLVPAATSRIQISALQCEGMCFMNGAMEFENQIGIRDITNIPHPMRFFLRFKKCQENIYYLLFNKALAFPIFPLMFRIEFHLPPIISF